MTGGAEVVMTITVYHQDGTYWSQVEESPRFTAVDETLKGLLTKVVDAWEEMGGWDGEPART